MQPTDIQVPPVLRDRVHTALATRTTPATAAELAAELLPPMQSAYRQVHRSLVQLEEQGLARRQPTSPITWTTTT